MHLSALSLLVPDYDTAISFYCDVLGFTLTEDIDQENKRWVRVTPPGGGCSFILAKANPEQKAMIGQQGAGKVWLFLETKDFAADHDRLQKAGVNFEKSPRHEPYGIVAVFRDPFGNRWNLVQHFRPD